MMKAAYLVLCVAALSCNVQAQSLSDATAQRVGLSAEGLKGIGTVRQKHIDAGEIPGALALVARRGEIAYVEALGRIDSKTPLHKDTVFWMASMTKPIVATTVLMMVEEGKVALSDPVSKFVPEFRTPSRVRVLQAGSPPPNPQDPNAPKPQYELTAAARPITVKDLLTHTSGLQTINVPNDAIPPLQAGDTLASWVAKLGAVPLDFQPGTKWAYSNATGFDVLARIVEVASGITFDRFVKQRLLEPLGMSASSFGPRADLAARTMPSDPRFATNPCLTGATFFCGSAGLWMSAHDYARFAQMLLNQGEFGGKRVLSPRSVAMLATNHTGKLFPGSSGLPGAAKGVGFGLSVAVVEDAATGLAVPKGSFGWDGVGSRRFWVIPQEQMIIVMLVPGGTSAPVHRDIERAAMAAIQRSE